MDTKGFKIVFYSFCTFAATACNFTSNTVTKNPKEKSAIAISDSITVKFEPVSDIAELPVEMNEPSPGGNLFVTDITGKIWILHKDSMLAKPFFDRYGNLYKGSPGSSIGRLYSVAFHPQYLLNHKFYVCYAAPSSRYKKSGKLVISQFTSDEKNPEISDLKSEKKVLEVEGSNVAFNGAQIRFGPDGYLYISIGDDKANDSSYKYRAQDLRYLNGKLLRIDVDNLPYTIPADNPFKQVKNARPEIWAYGFRKLWRYSFDPVSHQLFGGDVGENMEEEIDVVTKGGNYGWPEKEGDSIFEKNDLKSGTPFTSPIYTYTHVKGICVIGGNFYYGKDLPQLTNKYVFADWKGCLFALGKDQHDKWNALPLKIVNKPSDSFFICGSAIDANNQIYVMGYLVNKNGDKGVIYKVVKS
ncbi:MAG: PQQ-dependent sugar dehydrogenase [Bacteroidota bacterium]|nr:PQQ-dependent sugar dehydrogenase [Bacteroidota bacterium]